MAVSRRIHRNYALTVHVTVSYRREENVRTVRRHSCIIFVYLQHHPPCIVITITSGESMISNVVTKDESPPRTQTAALAGLVHALRIVTFSLFDKRPTGIRFARFTSASSSDAWCRESTMTHECSYSCCCVMMNILSTKWWSTGSDNGLNTRAAISSWMFRCTGRKLAIRYLCRNWSLLFVRDQEE